MFGSLCLYGFFVCKIALFFCMRLHMARRCLVSTDQTMTGGPHLLILRLCMQVVEWKVWTLHTLSCFICMHLLILRLCMSRFFNLSWCYLFEGTRFSITSSTRARWRFRGEVRRGLLLVAPVALLRILQKLSDYEKSLGNIRSGKGFRRNTWGNMLLNKNTMLLSFNNSKHWYK